MYIWIFQLFRIIQRHIRYCERNWESWGGWGGREVGENFDMGTGNEKRGKMWTVATAGNADNSKLAFRKRSYRTPNNFRHFNFYCRFEIAKNLSETKAKKNFVQSFKYSLKSHHKIFEFFKQRRLCFICSGYFCYN